MRRTASSGVPVLPSGVSSISFAFHSSLIQPVSVAPGSTLLTVIPFVAADWLKLNVSPSMDALVAEYGMQNAMGLRFSAGGHIDDSTAWTPVVLHEERLDKQQRTTHIDGVVLVQHLRIDFGKVCGKVTCCVVHQDVNVAEFLLRGGHYLRRHVGIPKVFFQTGRCR